MYSDADWGGDISHRVSTSDYILFVCCNQIIWFSKKQNIVSRSSTESEYKAVANALFETLWVINILNNLCFPLHQLPTIYCYNPGATFLSKNHVLYSRVKHVTLDLHFVCYHVNIKSVCVIHVHGADQIADTLTKGLPKSAFENNLFKLGLVIHYFILHLIQYRFSEPIQSKKVVRLGAL